MPAEWEPQKRSYVAWQHQAFYAPQQHAQVRQEQTLLIHTIAQFQPVVVLHHPADPAPVLETTSRFGHQILPMAVSDIWTRDTMPSFVLEDGALRAVGWNFNVWGDDAYGYDDDLTLARRLAAHEAIPFERADLIAEGGALEVNGQGVLLTTESCLLTRNPGLSKTAIERALKASTGCERILWLPGSPTETITDGHIDGLARFAGPHRLLVELSDDPADPEYHDLRENLRAAQSAMPAGEVITILRPRWDVIEPKSPDFAASYVNYTVLNGAIIMPCFGDDARDRSAQTLLAKLFPQHQILMRRVDAICGQGGGIHCTTNALPQVL